MSYRISYYDTISPSLKKWRNEDGERTEVFSTEHEALKRARELLDEGEVHGVMVADDAGSVLGGIRLQLKLGFNTVE
jgi:hypothetical protein